MVDNFIHYPSPIEIYPLFIFRLLAKSTVFSKYQTSIQIPVRCLLCIRKATNTCHLRNLGHISLLAVPWYIFFITAFLELD